MKRIFVLLSFISIHCLYSQQILRSNQIYFDHNIAYRGYDVTVLSGIVEFRDPKGLLTRREIYEHGIMTKKIIYHTTNIEKKNVYAIPYQEINYKDRKIISRISFRPSGDKYYYTEFDEVGNQKYSEQWRDGQLAALQFFKNGKLDGKAAIMDIHGVWTEATYIDGEFMHSKELGLMELNEILAVYGKPDHDINKEETATKIENIQIKDSLPSLPTEETSKESESPQPS